MPIYEKKNLTFPLIRYTRLKPLASYLHRQQDLYVKESIQAYEIKLEREADCDEAVWCKIVSGNSKLTIGLVYRSPNINEEDNTKIKTLYRKLVKGNVS